MVKAPDRGDPPTAPRVGDSNTAPGVVPGAARPPRGDEPLASRVVVELTHRCTQDCLHCPRPWKNAAGYPHGELPTAETLLMLRRAIDESGARHVTLSGGEPLLRHDLLRIVDWLHQRGLETTLSTNGALLHDAVLRRLLPNTIDVFELPLLSSVARIHDELSGFAGAHRHATRAFAKLQAASQTTIAAFVATRLNVATLGATLGLAADLGVAGVKLQRFNPGGRGWANNPRLQLDPETLRHALDLANDFTKRHQIPTACTIAMPECLFDRARWPHLSFSDCCLGTPDCRPTLDPLGNLRPCAHSPRILGNLRTRTAAALLQSGALRQYEQTCPDFCRDCPKLASCKGGCRAAAEVCFGDPRYGDPLLVAYSDQLRKPT